MELEKTEIKKREEHVLKLGTIESHHYMRISHGVRKKTEIKKREEHVLKLGTIESHHYMNLIITCVSAMELETQPVPLPLYNYDNVTKPITFVRHNILFGGSNKRVLIVGPSGCGKTNALIALLLHENGLRFMKSLHQEKYGFLRSVMTNTPEIGYREYVDINDLEPPEKMLGYSVIVFDDIIVFDQAQIKIS
ncbi:hypothetical protein QE152_g23232 [Popillia japonica]|uniref:Uncharacterized protein n=1 Tax=Popillia japonica TaxID=7064 RepID=A0AAW1KG13_POPJA